ncbi:hypothetical protein [Streptomyces sp. SID13588]|uniref:BACON domain-containing protein n=1 Tax=Streptomyces sp. SID13588 TaxID=2706051 RepID=UPI0013C5A7C2|nr:hypothetical protein [Streptomyces sp. SID13588]NEA74585.1 hypothetical protein [Streptomyces sp. SID13588]
MSRQETHPQDAATGPRTGTHRKHRATAPRTRPEPRSEQRKDRRPHGTLPMQPPAHYEPYLDGLFTYCLSVLCEHDAAAAALGEVLALAERQRGRLREAGLRRPWLYALARWSCRRRLAAGRPDLPRMSEAVAAERRGQLAALAWPEAAGTTPEQREALELAVRHQLPPHEVGHVLGIEADAARALLARAACEVERTRAALAVVEVGTCAAVARLAGDTQVLLGTALRRELVRHVDDCPECRLTAERAVVGGPWPGTATTAATAVLTMLEAPRSAAYAALMHSMRDGAGRSREGTPRFDRRGFPLDHKDRAARRAQLRHRAVTTTVVAAVVAAPVLALWAAYRGAPIGADQPGGGISASEPDGADGIDGHPYEKAGSTGSNDAHHPATPRTTVSVDTSASPSTPPGTPTPGAPGHLTVTAGSHSGTTVITLTATGDTPVHWTASTAAYWLHLSATSGDLRPGESATLTVTVDHSTEPTAPWTARILLNPSGAVVTVRGHATPPTHTKPPTPTPTHTQTPTPTPTTQEPSPTPTPTPSESSSAPPAA